MLHKTIVRQIATEIVPATLHHYLVATGWEQTTPTPDYLIIYRRPRVEANHTKLFIPQDPDLGNHQQRLLEAVYTLAEWEQREITSLLHDLKLPMADILRFSWTNSSTTPQVIPLHTARELLAAVTALLRAAARTTVMVNASMGNNNRAAHIQSPSKAMLAANATTSDLPPTNHLTTNDLNFDKLNSQHKITASLNNDLNSPLTTFNNQLNQPDLKQIDDFISQCQLITESDTITILYFPNQSQDWLANHHALPFMRQVLLHLVATLQQLALFASQTLTQLIDPTVVLPNATPPLLTALLHLVPPTARQTLQISTTWARTYPVAAPLPRTITFSHTISTLLTTMLAQLNQTAQPSLAAVTGKIVALNGRPGLDGWLQGEVILAFLVNAEIQHTTLELNSEDYAQACRAYTDNLIVAVIGNWEQQSPHYVLRQYQQLTVLETTNLPPSTQRFSGVTPATWQHSLDLPDLMEMGAKASHF
jgi:hypothetical protein